MGLIDFIKDILRPGNGVDYPQAGDMVTVHYHGYLYDPTRSRNRGVGMFDSSIKRGYPFTFRIGMGTVIKGWEVGILGMSLGEKAYLTFGPQYGYGEKGAPPFIPGNSPLVFQVELLAINGRTMLSDDSD
ncbi:FK506-binding protein 1A [Aspergillus heteromorphus CBS 117.55]|uniref:peptidylprolyl isomerase n=1 Tax=Aspergillus heteromorphus CBS 117.55 TaxID=1448321 RepID=A0A317WGC9_9EURO|nr:FK506-binding protein 1A [Aspergillus heteromorphus CBS 117.55]PWY84761.1 FK506-binding protein 1A [Aspergillus heteromorphus CBS 117.55]